MTPLNRADIVAIVGNDAKRVAAFESLLRTVAEQAVQGPLNVARTAKLEDATVLTLSPNDALNNERVVEGGQGIALTDTGNNLIIALAFVLTLTQGYRLSINLLSDTDLTIPVSGTMMVSEAPTAVLGNYASDAAASGAGVPVGGLYRNGNAVMVRVA